MKKFQTKSGNQYESRYDNFNMLTKIYNRKRQNIMYKNNEIYSLGQLMDFFKKNKYSYCKTWDYLYKNFTV